MKRWLVWVLKLIVLGVCTSMGVYGILGGIHAGIGLFNKGAVAYVTSHDLVQAKEVTIVKEVPVVKGTSQDIADEVKLQVDAAIKANLTSGL